MSLLHALEHLLNLGQQSQAHGDATQPALQHMQHFQQGQRLPQQQPLGQPVQQIAQQPFYPQMQGGTSAPGAGFSYANDGNYTPIQGPQPPNFRPKPYQSR